MSNRRVLPFRARRARAASGGRRPAALLLVAGLATAAAAVLLTPRGPALAATGDPAEIIGVASVIDADTIEIRGERIRLEGVDAPESGQRCLSEAGTLYRCGAAAANALDAFLAGNPVTCAIDGRDRYKRILATCTVRGESVQEWLVASGHALAYRRYSMRYVETEARAQEAGSGVWAGRFVMPWDWRKGVRLPEEDAARRRREGV